VQLSEELVVQEPASKWDWYAMVTDDTYRNKAGAGIGGVLGMSLSHNIA
jgi:hypothetical protein